MAELSERVPTAAQRRFLQWAGENSPFGFWPIEFARKTFRGCREAGWIEQCGLDFDGGMAALIKYRITPAGRAALKGQAQ